ncbi:MAG: hypothetical protein CME71_11845 [Halobacteriovorax sp.]|nr:hypothetical protein [Halobacteriovorax sp.]|tara:strand:- start:3941 stop:4468 length:528 start_codon:yes stop_codon:yes gene_type:complete
MSPKIIFAAISAAASVAGAVMKVQAAKQQASLQTAQLELQSTQVGYQQAVDTAARFDRHRRIIATQAAYGGASGGQFGGHTKSMARSANKIYERDKRVIAANAAFSQANIGYQRIGVNLMKKSATQSAYMGAISSIGKLGYTAYQGGLGTGTPGTPDTPDVPSYSGHPKYGSIVG